MINTKTYTAKKIAEIIDGELLCDDCEINYISTDSREQGDFNRCFFAIKGSKYDGEDFVDDAIKNGAKIVVSSNKKRRKGIIYVDDVKLALMKLAKFNKGSTKIIAVTGSAGKTTVKEMINLVVSQKYKSICTFSNNNNEIGLAQTLLSITDEEYCIVEMGMRRPGEIDFLAKIAEPDISIITNVGSAHIELLKTKENIYKAKSEILPYTKNYAILPSDEWFKKIDYKSLKYIFIGESSSVKIKAIDYFESGINVTIFDNNLNTETTVKIHTFFLHDAQNFLFAYMVGRLLDIPQESIKQGIFEFKNYKNRGEILKIGKLTVIDDCYNASYESVKNGIFSLFQYAKNQNKNSILVMGDMLEIGKKSFAFHKQIGKYAKEIGIKNILALGKYSKAICDGFEGGITFRFKSDIAQYICKNLDSNNIILIKASRNMHFETIIDELKERLNEN